MAYIGYDQKSVGGMQVAEALADLAAAVRKLQDLASWVGEIGPGNLESNADFKVDAGGGQGFNDTLVGIANAAGAMMTAQAEPIARLARGS